jgi:hypothetical protein
MSEADKTEKESKVVIKQVEFQVIIPQSQLLLNAEYIVFENPLREITDLYSHNLNTRIFHPPLI